MARVFLLSLPILLSGCAVLPQYTAPESDTTTIQVNKLSSPWICVDNVKYSLKADEQGNVTIPTSERITIGNSHRWQGYNVTYSCNSSMSFIPQKNIPYYANWEVIEEACRVEIYQKSDKNRVGLVFDPTIARGRCQ